MSDNLVALMVAAAGIGFGHTAIGVDHYVPFITLGRAQNWSFGKTMGITALCGIGHVLGSLVLAFAGIALGETVQAITGLESQRGTIASWILIAFGFTYAAWGLWNTMRGHEHNHVHTHADGTVHDHGHHHNEGDHVHVHEVKKASLVTVMSMFIIFVFGPCEFMIAPVMAAHQHGWFTVVAVSLAFSVSTIGTMVGAVALGYFGFQAIRMQFLERHLHTVTGLLIALSGLILPYLET